jgi:hypothetical protein
MLGKLWRYVSSHFHHNLPPIVLPGFGVEERVPPFSPSSRRSSQIFAALSSADGYKNMLSKLTPDPKEPSMQLTTLGPSLPRTLFPFKHPDRLATMAS